MRTGGDSVEIVGRHGTAGRLDDQAHDLRFGNALTGRIALDRRLRLADAAPELSWGDFFLREPVAERHAESNTISVSIRPRKYTGLVLDLTNLPLYPSGMGILTNYRKRAGLSQNRLAELVGTSQPQIQRLEKGTRGLSKKWATKIAPHVRTIPEELMFGDRSVPIVGIVSAGEAHFDVEANLGRARMPRGGAAETVAVEIRGDSLGGAFDGWLIYYDERREPPTDDLLGSLCVVGLASGQVLVKLLMRGRQPGHFDLFSGASGKPLTDQPVAWATRVAAIMPPWLAKLEEFGDAPTRKKRRKTKRSHR